MDFSRKFCLLRRNFGRFDDLSPNFYLNPHETWQITVHHYHFPSTVPWPTGVYPLSHRFTVETPLVTHVSRWPVLKCLDRLDYIRFVINNHPSTLVNSRRSFFLTINMTTSLDYLKQTGTVVVSDSGDFESELVSSTLFTSTLIDASMQRSMSTSLRSSSSTSIYRLYWLELGCYDKPFFDLGGRR